jgi:3-phosphoshikimate 1-carboxyvinyltransferase
MRKIPRLRRAQGTVAVPPSKSYTARALLLAAIAEGPTTVEGALDADDSRYMLEALRTVGFRITGRLGTGITIGDRESISASEVEISIGNAGTAMRFLTGFLAFTPGRFLLTGDDRMQERPIGDLVDVLQSLGVEVEYAERDGFPPLRIRGKRMRGGDHVRISAQTSSQFVSSLLMAATTLPSGLSVQIDSPVSQPYIDITIDVLRSFGAVMERDGNRIDVRGGALRLDSYRVEGDFSSASYWFAAAAATAGNVAVSGLRRESVQGDAGFLDLLRSMGCAVGWEDEVVRVIGPSSLTGGRFDCNAIPDVAPTLAAIAPLAAGGVHIANIANLRVKECDRITALAEELRKLGATAAEGPDWLRVEAGWSETAAVIDPHGDHRLAMSFAIAGLARGGVEIADEQVVSKSYPRFWKTLDELVATSERN